MLTVDSMNHPRHINGRSLRAIRLLAGVSLRGLAGSARIDPGYLSKIETGQRQPSPAIARALAVRLGVPTDAITKTETQVAA